MSRRYDPPTPGSHTAGLEAGIDPSRVCPACRQRVRRSRPEVPWTFNEETLHWEQLPPSYRITCGVCRTAWWVTLADVAKADAARRKPAEVSS